jgi:hypothetical protein
MFIVYIALWMLLILVVGGWLVGRQSRKAAAGMKQLAAALGFGLLENMEAIDRSIVPAMRQAARDAREKMPRRTSGRLHGSIRPIRSGAAGRGGSSGSKGRRRWRM